MGGLMQYALSIIKTCGDDYQRCMQAYTDPRFIHELNTCTPEVREEFGRLLNEALAGKSELRAIVEEAIAIARLRVTNEGVVLEDLLADIR